MSNFGRKGLCCVSDVVYTVQVGPVGNDFALYLGGDLFEFWLVHQKS